MVWLSGRKLRNTKHNQITMRDQQLNALIAKESGNEFGDNELSDRELWDKAGGERGKATPFKYVRQTY